MIKFDVWNPVNNSTINLSEKTKNDKEILNEAEWLVGGK